MNLIEHLAYKEIIDEFARLKGRQFFFYYYEI